MDYLTGILTGLVLYRIANNYYTQWQEEKEIERICRELKQSEQRRKFEEEAQSAVDGLMNELGYKVDGD
jgi:hypothetical protein